AVTSRTVACSDLELNAVKAAPAYWVRFMTGLRTAAMGWKSDLNSAGSYRSGTTCSTHRTAGCSAFSEPRSCRTRLSLGSIDKYIGFSARCCFSVAEPTALWNFG